VRVHCAGWGAHPPIILYGRNFAGQPVGATWAAIPGGGVRWWWSMTRCDERFESGESRVTRSGAPVFQERPKLPSIRTSAQIAGAMLRTGSGSDHSPRADRASVLCSCRNDRCPCFCSTSFVVVHYTSTLLYRLFGV
jgi:hypothetical protein